MEIIEICKEITRLYQEPIDNYEEGYSILQLVYKLRLEIDHQNFTLQLLDNILVTTSLIANSKKKKSKQLLEKELLILISYLPHKLWQNNETFEKIEFNQKNKKIAKQIADRLVDFAIEIYKIKIDRDAFAGTRRGYAIQTLENLSNYFTIPEFLQLCNKSIRSKSKIEFLDTIESLKNYYLEMNKIPEDTLIEQIDKRILKTKHRTVAVSILNFQVETGIIDEMDALMRIDQWKEKNNYY